MVLCGGGGSLKKPRKLEIGYSKPIWEKHQGKSRDSWANCTWRKLGSVLLYLDTAPVITCSARPGPLVITRDHVVPWQTRYRLAGGQGHKSAKRHTTTALAGGVSFPFHFVSGHCWYERGSQEVKHTSPVLPQLEEGICGAVARTL